jgi:predicted adenine nucleotide alpha hydrolase (AANH) superfamily ATPase
MQFYQQGSGQQARKTAPLKIFLHMCCAPCTVYPLRALEAEEVQIIGFFFNPNIHPFQEYRRRIETVRQFAAQATLEVIYRDDYDVVRFLRQVVFRESERCRFCYHLRLEAAAQRAKESRMDAFTTTLLYSRRQNHELIRQLGEEVGKQVGIPFLYRDFRQGWRDGIERSKALGLYRQNYCGCIYSEQERFQKGAG